MCKDQENTINQLKNDLTLLREERETETETFSTQVNTFLWLHLISNDDL